MAREPAPASPFDTGPQSAPSAMPFPLRGARPTEHPDPAGMPPPEVKVATEWLVFCDGGEGALGHPRVFYSIPHEPGWIDCGYCDARFVHKSKLTGHRSGDRTSGGDHNQPGDLSAEVRGKQPESSAGVPDGGSDKVR